MEFTLNKQGNAVIFTLNHSTFDSLISSEFCAILWKSSPLWVKRNFPRVYPDTTQFSSVVQLCLTLHDPMDCSMPGLPVHHQLPVWFYSNSCWWCHPTISSSVVPFSSCLQSFPASGCFPRSQLFASSGQSIGQSNSTLAGWFFSFRLYKYNITLI